jgi:glycosyltransferase involved in cell wall biosynthesis
MPPLISCIMPTRDRGDYVVQAVRYFQRQDYPDRELILVDDSRDDLAPRLPADPRIRCVRTPPGLSIGAKRNRAVRLARGEIIAQWDDDDWYGDQRLSAQAAPLLAGQADVTGLEAGVFFELERWRFWRCTPALHRRLFVGDVHGGTLLFRKRLWELAGGYPDRSLAEDAALLRQMQRRGGRLLKLPNRDLFIYLRHGANAWSFACGAYLDPAGWLPVDEPPLPAEDRTFYAQRVQQPVQQPVAAAPCPAAPEPEPARRPRPSFTVQSSPSAGQRPLVSCIMPTAGRRAFVGQAIAYFLRQDYYPAELLVIDDGADAVADLLPDDPRVRYLRLERRRSVGAKRNLACEAAAGEIIVHWDDDDWCAPRRLRYQVDELLRQGADICGLSAVNYYDPWQRQAWQYVYPPHAQTWVAGNTLCYRKAFWRSNPFADIDVGEDTRFVQARLARRLAVLPDASFFVAVIHARNVSPKRPRGARWRPLAVAEIERLLGEDLAFYGWLRNE